jgi:hypothetical protein
MPVSNAAPPLPASGQDLYNILMAPIDPDLTTDRLTSLAVTCRGESPGDARVRATKYAAAYAAYDRAYQDWKRSTTEQVNRYRKAAFQCLEQEDRSRDRVRLSTFESILFPA